MGNKDKVITSDIGNYLKIIRKNKGFRLVDLAQKSGISVSYLNRLERNQRFNPSIPLLTRLANSLDITIFDLLQISSNTNEHKAKDMRDIILEDNYVMEGKNVSEEARGLLYDIIIFLINEGWKNENKVDMLSEELIRKVKYLNQVL